MTTPLYLHPIECCVSAKGDRRKHLKEEALVTLWVIGAVCVVMSTLKTLKYIRGVVWGFTQTAAVNEDQPQETRLWEFKQQQQVEDAESLW